MKRRSALGDDGEQWAQWMGNSVGMLNTVKDTYPLQLLEVLPQERNRIVRPGHAQLHDAILEHPLDPVRLDVGLALPQALLFLQQRRHNCSCDFEIPPGASGTTAAAGI